MGEVITEKDQRGQKEALLKDLDLEQVLDRNVENLSGGELQRFAIAVVAAQEGEWRLRSALGSVCVQQCVLCAVGCPHCLPCMLLLAVSHATAHLLIRSFPPFPACS